MKRTLRISAVEPQKRHKDRYNIYIDGEYRASLGGEACIVYGIKAGCEVSEDTLNDAVMHDNTQYAFDSALSLLSHKMRTRFELTERLTQRGMDERAIAAAMEKLISYGYVDDRTYAAAFVESTINAGSHGPMVLQHKLRQKGLNDDVIDETMKAYSNEIEKEIAALQLASLRQRYAGEDFGKRRRKMFAALQRRGFSYDIINTLLAEEEDFEI